MVATANLDAKEHMSEIREQNNAKQKAALRGKARNHCTKHFAKTPCHRLTPPTCPRPAGTGCNTTLTLLMGTEGGQGDGLPSAVEAKMGHPSPSECPHGQDLPGWWWDLG